MNTNSFKCCYIQSQIIILVVPTKCGLHMATNTESIQFIFRCTDLLYKTMIIFVIIETEVKVQKAH